MKVIKTILADDHRIFIEGLKSVLQRCTSPRFDIVGIAFDGEELSHLIRQRSAQLLIFDLNLPGKDGIDILNMLRHEGIGLKTLALSRYDDPKIIKFAFKAGVDGYILKDKHVDELFIAVNEIITGGDAFVGEGVAFYDSRPRRRNGRAINRPALFQDSFVRKHHLTKREVEILRLITEALSNKEIARELFISDQTVSVHRKNIMRKLGVSNTAALIKTAFENSLV